MHLQQKTLVMKCSVNKRCSAKICYACTALLYSCNKNPLKILVKGFQFTSFAGQQPTTLLNKRRKGASTKNFHHA